MHSVRLRGSGSMTGFILSGVVATWRVETQRSGFRETGGMLLGYWARSGYPVITHATGPGPNAKRGFLSFAPDHEYCQRSLERLFEASGGELTFVGDWHTHVTGGLRPSSTDTDTALRIAGDQDYQCKRPLIALYSATNRLLGFRRQESFRIWCVGAEEQLVQPLESKVIDGVPGYDLPSLRL